MKNYLQTITENPIVKKLCTTVGNYYVLHEGGILTTGTIIFNAAGIAITYRNSPQIHKVLESYHDLVESIKVNEQLSVADKKELTKQATQETFKDLAPLVAPIFVFFGASTGCAIVNKKQSDAKIASLSAALSLAQSTVKEYNEFRKEAVGVLGEEKVAEIDKTVTEKRIEEDPPKEPEMRDLSDGVVPFFDPYANEIFYSTMDRIKYACECMSNELLACDEVDLSKYHDIVGVEPTDLDENIVWHSYKDGCKITPVKVPFEWRGTPCFKITLSPMPRGYDR